MYLGNPMLPLALSAKEALEKLNKILAEKNWKDFEAGELKLVLVPYYFFSYHSHTEKEVGGEKIVSSSKDGMLALNGSSLLIEDKKTNIIKENLQKLDQEIPQIEHEVKNSQITKSNQDHILKIKTAEFLQIEKDNVVISNVKKIMFPMYESFITIKKETYNIIISAVDGEVYGIEKVPEREKGFLEITQETFRDLKDPKQWVEYTKGLAVETKNFLTEKKHSPSDVPEVSIKTLGKNKLSLLSTKWFIILIILLALFLIYLAFFV